MGMIINFSHEKNKIYIKDINKSEQEAPLRIKSNGKIFTFVSIFSNITNVRKYNKNRREMGFLQKTVKKGDKYLIYSKRK